MNIEDKISFLRNVRIFSDTSFGTIESVAREVRELSCRENEVIFAKGDTGDSMYFIVSGEVKVHDHDHVFTRLKSCDFFGKYFLIDQKERSASVTSLRPSVFLVLNQNEFYRFTNADPTILNGILKELVGRLRQMNVAEEKLAVLNATKDKFFSVIAHDLRSPITTLISLSEILRTEMDLLTPEQKNDVLNSLYDLSKNYLKLLDNLLQWAQVQTGRMKSNPERFNINALIGEVLALYKTNADEKELALREETVESAEVFADKNMIRSVLRNLIGNALKFTPRRGEVSAVTFRTGHELTVKITDTGVGMTPETVTGLFNLESAHSTRGTENERGTGLGLILCKEFVEQNGGRITVESKPGTGSIFAFTLPLMQPSS